MNKIEKSVLNIKSNYRFYRKSDYSGIWSKDNQANKYLIEKLKEKFLSIMPNKLKDKNILDVGCGNGWLLDLFYSKGANKENLYGVDLNKKINKFKFKIAEASNLPFKSNFFDIITASTLFSSVLNSEHRKLIAEEILRVLKKQGIIIVYDIRFNNPFNKRVTRIDKKEIKRLFGNKKFKFIKTTLNPIILRKVYKILPISIKFLEKLSFLKSHYLTIIKLQ